MPTFSVASLSWSSNSMLSRWSSKNSKTQQLRLWQICNFPFSSRSQSKTTFSSHKLLEKNQRNSRVSSKIYQLVSDSEFPCMWWIESWKKTKSCRLHQGTTLKHSLSLWFKRWISFYQLQRTSWSKKAILWKVIVQFLTLIREWQHVFYCLRHLCCWTVRQNF